MLLTVMLTIPTSRSPLNRSGSSVITAMMESGM